MFAEILFQIQFKPLPVLLASTTGHSQQYELYIQKNALKKIELQNSIPFKSII